jgi:hypothetical protein
MPTRTAPHDSAHGQIKTAPATQPREPRSPLAEKWILAGWVLILLKCTGVWWAINTYNVPLHPMWLVGPTIGFAALATALYIWRD